MVHKDWAEKHHRELLFSQHLFLSLPNLKPKNQNNNIEPGKKVEGLPSFPQPVCVCRTLQHIDHPWYRWIKNKCCDCEPLASKAALDRTGSCSPTSIQLPSNTWHWQKIKACPALGFSHIEHSLGCILHHIFNCQGQRHVDCAFMYMFYRFVRKLFLPLKWLDWYII